ncbi:structure-specific endonuclease subunit SLX4 [Drosophila sulfurigaster albostrigata]|uniref:structure-specific endonuclease subunit SLX4 n=1 Tax=Drosophila sulfurigaster albostrigata TaxID=89887 RepID=UPI002D21950B|nr:structure-specific endonuclease subunit SLX4 [Drosophila sulfurigaster albostrigata]
MERKTRRANLKKLQEPATTSTTKLRTTRNNKHTTATTTLSEYFDSQESLCNQPTPSNEAEQLNQNTKKEDLFTEPQRKKSRECHETKPLPKKAPKLKSSAAPARQARGRGTGRGRGKQPSISDFLRNEQLFAEVAAQHCRADNFSPDDIEMALALSKSEAEKHGILRLEDSADAEEEVVNLLDDNLNQSTENIRRKLQKYGFRTAPKEDYNQLSISVFPGKRSKRCRWANKFTALTLRNPEEQLKKVDIKVANLMSLQVRTKLPTAEEMRLEPFELISIRLQQLKASSRIIHEPNDGAIGNLPAYYVEELIEVSRTPAHHLLKNWAAIQGRDLSPKRLSAESKQKQNQLEQVYVELEAYYGERAATVEQKELDELEKLVANNMVQEEEFSRPSSSAESIRAGAEILSEECTQKNEKLPTSTAIEESHEESLLVDISTTDKKSNLQSCSFAVKEKTNQLNLLNKSQHKEKENLLPHTSFDSDDKANLLPSKFEQSSSAKENRHRGSIALTLPTQITRCASPDLFADSDDELNLEMPTTLGEMQNFSLRAYKETTSTEINCYEIYSSDEVKTLATAFKNETETTHSSREESIVDLTEEQESPELPVIINSGNCLATLSQEIALSPTDDFNYDPGEPCCPLEDQNDCVISEELFAKYAHKISQAEDEADLSFRVSRISSDAKSFELSLPKTPNSIMDNSLPHKCNGQRLQQEYSFKSPLSRKSISFSGKSLPRSQNSLDANSLSNGCSHRQRQLEHSFKRSLSRKSISFNDMTAFTCSQSDASIDLTQDSAGNEDFDEGVLLSDDEINYSIWKADKTQRNMEQAPKEKRKSLPYFQTLEELDAFLDARPASPAASIKSCNSRSPNKSALSKERAEFGILDAALSQPFTLSQLPSSEKPETSEVAIDWTDASFLDTPAEQALKRYSTNSRSHKFKQLLNTIPNTVANEVGDDLDEFDRMVLQSSKVATNLDDGSMMMDHDVMMMPSGFDRLLNDKINTDTMPKALPSGLDSLLKGEINMDTLPRTALSEADQVEVHGQLFTVRVCQSPKPDYVLMSEADLLQQLYNYGIKPLKRKQAVKLLEFIYNQMHPIMLPLEEQQMHPKPLPQPLPRSKSTPVGNKSSKPLFHYTSNNCLSPTKINEKPSYKFKDATGQELIRFSQNMSPGLCDDFEFYVMQTNVTKKTPQPLLPLHIAWHNLLCANPSLHESVLMYEPIDLQEIYQYLKQLGHRYDPKDLKCFFDRRCIIFRYDLAPSNKQVQRHLRKKPKKSSVKA